LGVDINKKVVDDLNQGEIHIFEKGIKESLRKSIDIGKFKANCEPGFSDVFIIAVPTPFKECKPEAIPEPDLEYVFSAISSCIPFLKPSNLIIIESTCPVGTTDRIKNFLISKNIDIDKIHLAYCPERVLPGNIMKELVYNDRVIGGIDKDSSLEAFKFYKTFCKGYLEISNAKTAEMVKLVENSYRDINLAFANQISIICDKESINVYDLISISNKHPRVDILKPGCGVGGHCIAVDPWFLIDKYKEDSSLLYKARQVNENKTYWVINKIKEREKIIRRYLGRDPTIACMGATFKANVDDIRNSPSLTIIKELIKSQINVITCDPYVNKLENIRFFSIEDIVNEADIFVLLVAHDKFKHLDFREKEILDFCGLMQN
tara:strand:+ start:4037 stop:5167 length:1131 start_codon:yes stop_codon:yes gene_type:complete